MDSQPNKKKTLKELLVPHINRIGNAVFFYDGVQIKKPPLMANPGLQALAKQRYGMDFSYLTPVKTEGGDQTGDNPPNTEVNNSEKAQTHNSEPNQ